MDRVRAGAVLRDLVAGDAAVKEGGRRHARYVLAPRARPELEQRKSPSAPPHDDAPDQITAHLSATAWTPARQIEEQTGLGRSWIVERLRDLVAQGVVEVNGAPTSPNRAYRLVRQP